MSKSIVIGNGTSRKGLDLEGLQADANIIACNWFFRDEFSPDILVTLDEPISRDIVRSHPDYVRNNLVYTREDFESTTLTPTPEGFGSGATAVYVAAVELESSDVFLVGMDFYGNDDGTVNNLYAGKTHYKEEGSPAPDIEGRVRRVEWIVRNYPDTHFYHVNALNGKTPSRLRGFNNFHQVSYDNMLAHLRHGSVLVDTLIKNETDQRIINTDNPSDIMAAIGRQVSGLPNILFEDLLTVEEVWVIKKKSNEKYRKNPNGYFRDEVAGVIVELPKTVLIDDQQRMYLPNEDQLRRAYDEEVIQRAEIKKQFPHIQAVKLEHNCSSAKFLGIVDTAK